ncbi:MAG TPA: phosphoribosylglycinamide formyltransferase [Spirochaetota bacterium]|nr:phosphoribosylglycinamide formyltransferase [Spirochaetota bacterium]
MKNKVVSFLASGRGSNFRAVMERIRDGHIPARPGILICDGKDAGAFAIADEFGMKSFFVDPKAYADRKSHEEAIVRLLRGHGTDLVVAAGYMRLLTPFIIGEFRSAIINVHPALLPAFPGVHAQRQALDYGVKISGCTTHFIDEGVDTGPIIMQAAVPVLPADTADSLAARILREEHIILPESVRLFCEGGLSVKGRKVMIRE